MRGLVMATVQASTTVPTSTPSAKANDPNYQSLMIRALGPNAPLIPKLIIPSLANDSQVA
jgi:hypothetical protein